MSSLRERVRRGQCPGNRQCAGGGSAGVKGRAGGRRGLPGEGAVPRRCRCESRNPKGRGNVKKDVVSVGQGSAGMKRHAGELV